MSKKGNKPGILCVANWPSDVGYAWWLMESYWVQISQFFAGQCTTYIAFPTLNTLPDAIAKSDIVPLEHTFATQSVSDIQRNVAFIKAHNIKVLYLSDYHVVKPAYALYRAAGVERIIVHDHTPGLRIAPTGIKRLLKRLYANLPGIRADAAIGATPFVRDRLHHVSCFAANRCYTVQNGIPFEGQGVQENEIHPLKAQLPEGRTIIVTASRANRYKGIDFALEVIAELVHKRHQTQILYVFCGDGPDLERFREKAETLNISDNCLFPGRVNNITSFFRHCHIAFQPSSGEVGYSLSILEYMAAALPVVVPDNPSVCGATESGETGFIYKAGDVEACSTCIMNYLENDTERQRQGNNAVETIEQSYTLARTHQALCEVLAEVVPLR